MVTLPVEPVACARQWMVWTPTKTSSESFWNLKVLISIAGDDRKPWERGRKAFTLLFFLNNYLLLNEFFFLSGFWGGRAAESHTQGWHQKRFRPELSINQTEIISSFLLSKQSCKRLFPGLGLAPKPALGGVAEAVTPRGAELGHSHGNIGSTREGTRPWFSGSDTNDTISCAKSHGWEQLLCFQGDWSATNDDVQWCSHRAAALAGWDRGTLVATRQDMDTARGSILTPKLGSSRPRKQLVLFKKKKTLWFLLQNQQKKINRRVPDWDPSSLAIDRCWAPLVLYIHRSTDWFYLDGSLPEIFLSFCPRTWFLVMLLRNNVEIIPFQFRKAPKCTQGRVSVKEAQHTCLDHIFDKNTGDTLFSCKKSWEIHSLDPVFQYFPT